MLLLLCFWTSPKPSSHSLKWQTTCLRLSKEVWAKRELVPSQYRHHHDPNMHRRNEEIIMTRQSFQNIHFSPHIFNGNGRPNLHNNYKQSNRSHNCHKTRRHQIKKHFFFQKALTFALWITLTTTCYHFS